MRLVLDANTPLSALIWQGVPDKIIDVAMADKIQLISSVPLLAELEGVLQRPKFQQAILQRGVMIQDLFDGYAALVSCVAYSELVVPVCRDADNDQVLAAAISGAADLIVSGDDDLLALSSFRGIAIVSARDALTWIEASQP